MDSCHKFTTIHFWIIYTTRTISRDWKHILQTVSMFISNRAELGNTLWVVWIFIMSIYYLYNKKIFTFWREKERLLCVDKVWSSSEENGPPTSTESCFDTRAGFLPSSPANKKLGRQQEFQSTWKQKQTNKDQRQLSSSPETTVSRALILEQGIHLVLRKVSPGPQKGFLSPKPEVIQRTGRPWGWEGNFWVTVRGVAVGAWGGTESLLPRRGALSQVYA